MLPMHDTTDIADRLRELADDIENDAEPDYDAVYTYENGTTYGLVIEGDGQRIEGYRDGEHVGHGYINNIVKRMR